MSSKKIIYADHSATTKVRAEVSEAMLQVMQNDFGNPSSVHSFGRKAKEHLDTARDNISSVINANPQEIFFTSGGTESDNLVIFGLAKHLEEGNIKNKDKHIISTKIEHSAVKEPLEYLEKRGWRISWLNVDNEGFIDINELKSLINSKTLLVSIIHANNEIGTIQDLKKISSICKENNVFFHTDAVQSFGKIPIDIKELKIDFMTISAHKIYGPKGIGALYIKSHEQISPLFIGGGQENKIRPGTENLPGIVGFGIAAKLLKDELHENAKKLRKLQIELMENLLKIEGIILTGPSINKVKENYPLEQFLHRIPGHVSMCCKDTEGESLVLQADLKGIQASSGSACRSISIRTTAKFEPSHILLAIGTQKDFVKGSLRLTLGKENTQEDVKNIVQSIKEISLLTLCR